MYPLRLTGELEVFRGKLVSTDAESKATRLRAQGQAGTAALLGPAVPPAGRARPAECGCGGDTRVAID